MIAAVSSILTLVFIAAGAIVGARILWLARSTKGLPETMLGLGLFLIVGIGYPMALAAPAVGVETAAGPALAATGIVTMALGWMGVWLFTWRVFRPHSGLARWTSISAMAGLLALGLWRAYGALSATRPEGLESAGPATLVFQLLAIAVYVWSGGESLDQWMRARRRMRLGLTDPVVANRFFLWFLVMLFSFLSLAGPIVGSILGLQARQVPAIQLSSSIAGIACAASLMLAFLPPRAYLSRVARSANA